MWCSTVPMVNMVSCRVDVPARLFGDGDLCCVGDQMLNIPPRQLRTGAGDIKHRNHQTHLSFGPCSTPRETTEETLQHCVMLWKESSKEPNVGSSLVQKQDGWVYYGAYSTFYQLSSYCITSKVYWYRNCSDETMPCLFTASPLDIKAPVWVKLTVLIMGSLKNSESNKEYLRCNKRAQRVECRKKYSF